MAKKDALRDLQNRLAERMKAVRTETQGQTWLAVDCAGQGVLFPLQQAGEIFEVHGVVQVPHTVDWLIGVANLRGGLYTVADLAAFLGLCPARRGTLPDHQRLVAFNTASGLNCALLVDRLEGLRHAADMQPDQDETEGERPAFAVARWRDGAGRMWQEIALSELATHEVFLGIAG